MTTAPLVDLGGELVQRVALLEFGPQRPQPIAERTMASTCIPAQSTNGKSAVR